ncbi:hypothetical protein Q31b_17110 [Novipirellula aureliae]|uniref:Two component regulator propeller n=1 Tax=Novipirellula aureliae TaxID=2527966 RepID=A0A5C6E6D3_9BACT|nr:hypothetical protein Q31b_17110 [Novipirellula aureliae]
METGAGLCRSDGVKFANLDQDGELWFGTFGGLCRMRDSNSLDGEKTYRIHLPANLRANLRAKRFWDRTISDNQTCST